MCNKIKEELKRINDKYEVTQKTLSLILGKLINPNAIEADGFAPPRNSSIFSIPEANSTTTPAPVARTTGPFMNATINPSAAGSTSTTDLFMNETINPPSTGLTLTTDLFMNETINVPAAGSSSTTDLFMNATITSPAAGSASTTDHFMNETFTSPAAGSASTTDHFMNETFTPPAAGSASTTDHFMNETFTSPAAGSASTTDHFINETFTPPAAGSTSTTDLSMNETINPPSTGLTSTTDHFMNATITPPAASSTPQIDVLRDITFDTNLPSPIDFEEVPSSIALSSGILENGDIQRIKRISCSRKNFASRLVRELFDEPTRRKSNVKGKLGKLQLNPVLIDYVKSLTFQYYPLEQFEKENNEWAECIVAIDEANRRKPKSKKLARQS